MYEEGDQEVYQEREREVLFERAPVSQLSSANGWMIAVCDPCRESRHTNKAYVTWSIPRLNDGHQKQYAYEGALKTYSSALCISSSVADMNSVPPRVSSYNKSVLYQAE